MNLCLKQLRVTEGLSQRDVAGKLGVSQTVYQRYEKGTREPDIAMMCQLADFFGVTLDVLVCRNAPAGTQLLTDEECAVLKMYRRLSVENKALIYGLLKAAFKEPEQEEPAGTSTGIQLN